MDEIFTSNNEGENVGVMIMRLFYDLIGVLRAISYSSIFVVFIKVTYEKVQALIEKEGSNYIHEENFMVAMLSFYDIMCKNCLEKLQRDSNAVFFKVINDAFILLNSLVSECNEALEPIVKSGNLENLKGIISKKSKIMFKFISIFNKIISSSSLNFSIFHFFENKTFLIFLKT